MGESSTMHIVCATDHNYVMPAGIMMSSLSYNNRSSEIKFYVLIDRTVTDTDKAKLQKSMKYSEHKVDFLYIDNSKFLDYPGLHREGVHQTAAAYDRLFLPKVMPASVDKVLYLDDDILVRGDLRKLWNTDITDYPIAAVTDMSEAVLDYNRLGYPQKDGYFNSGVVLINLKYWREHNVIKTFIDIICNHSNCIYAHDQDVLNIVFHDKKRTLPFIYNVQHGFYFKNEYIALDYRKYKEELEDARHNPVIQHFTGKKPWKINCQNPGAKSFLKYLRHSPWKFYIRKGWKEPWIRTKIGNILRSLNIIPPKNYSAYIKEYRPN